jgi:hypothetical protein
MPRRQSKLQSVAPYMANPIANPKIPAGNSTIHWPNIDDKKAHPDVARAVKLIYNAIDDHNQAWLAQANKAQLVSTIDPTSGVITRADPVIAGKYQTPPTVSAVGGGGSGAQFSVTLDSTGAIRSITVINGGSGYTSPPALVVTSND